MNHNSYPIRRTTIAFAAAASLVTAGCTSADSAPRHETKPGITAPDLHRHAGRAAIHNTLPTKRDLLGQAALTSARDIVNVAGNQASLCSPVNGSSVWISNESALVGEHRIGTMLPNISIFFDQTTRSISISSIQRLNPDSSLLDAKLSTLKLTFSLPQRFTELDLKYHDNQQLETTDFMTILADKDLTLTSLDLVRPDKTGDDIETNLDLSRTGDFSSSGQLGLGTPATQTIMSPDADIYAALRSELATFDVFLNQGASQY